MENFVTVTSTDTEQIYNEVIPQIESLVGDESDLIANLANVCAVFKMAFQKISWVGFYLVQGSELVLGPFQGKPACVRISMGKGVCGAAAEQQQPIVVPDVAKFPGHIVCDPASKSEIVVPIIRRGKVLGVLDIDSSSLAAFDSRDEKYLSQIVQILLPKFP